MGRLAPLLATYAQQDGVWAQKAPLCSGRDRAELVFCAPLGFSPERLDGTFVFSCKIDSLL